MYEKYPPRKREEFEDDDSEWDDEEFEDDDSEWDDEEFEDDDSEWDDDEWDDGDFKAWTNKARDEEWWNA